MRSVTVAIAAALIGAGSAAAQDHDMSKGMGMKMMETPWREMNGFHSLLHLGHQAMMKSGDLAPARRNAGRLAEAADAWAKSTAPTECHAPEGTGDKVAALAAEARGFATLAEPNGADAEIKAAFTKIHDTFEALHMVCMPTGMDHKGMDMKMEPKKPPR